MRSTTKIARERVWLIFAGVILLLALVAAAWRLRRGIDYTDEAFYLALPVRFAFGDRPFVDELNIGQTAGLILLPFVRAYIALRGTTGIFLFIRALYLVFFIGVGAGAYALGRTRLPRHAALLAAAPCVAFIPYAIPGLSYNTVGTGLVSFGLFLATRAWIAPPEDRPGLLRDSFTWAGFTLAAGSFAYPSLVVGAVAATVGTFVFASERRVLSAGRMVLGAAAFTACIVPSIVKAGPEHLREVFAYSGGAGLAGGSASLKALVLEDDFLARHPEATVTAMALAASVALARRWPRLVVFVLPFVPLLARGGIVGATTTSLGFVAALASVTPLVALALRDSYVARRIFFGVWLPSALCAAAMAWTSGNGSVATGLGFFPAAIATTILLTMWIRELARLFQSTSAQALFGFAPAVVLASMVEFEIADTFVYRDGLLPQLTTVITEGPYQGLLTTPGRERALAKLSADILAYAPSGRMLFYYDYPVGYIIASRRPNVPSAWIFAMEPRVSMDAAGFTRDAHSGDVVFKMDSMDLDNNPLDRAVYAMSDKVRESDGYSIWVVR